MGWKKGSYDDCNFTENKTEPKKDRERKNKCYIKRVDLSIQAETTKWWRERRKEITRWKKERQKKEIDNRQKEQTQKEQI